MRMTAWAAALALAGLLGPAAAAEDQPFYRDPSLRVGKFSFSLDGSYQDYQGEHFNRNLFFGGKFARTKIHDDYQISATAWYQFSPRFTIGLRGGYIKTTLKNAYGYQSDRLFDTINDHAFAILECRGVTENFETKYCDASAPIVDDVNNFSRTTLREKFLGGEYGDLKQIPLHAIFRVDLMTRTRWRPYIAGGIGYTKNSYRDNNATAAYVQNLLDSLPFNGTAAFCDYLAAEYPSSDVSMGFNCGGMVGPDGSTIVDGIMWKEGGAMKLFMDGIPYVDPDTFSWVTTLDNSWSWNLEGGFDWSFSKRWDLTSRLAYNWYAKKFQSTINGSRKELFIAIPNLEEIEAAAGTYTGNAPVSVTQDLDKMLNIIRLEPGRPKLESWSFALGFRYTFGR